MCLPKSARIQKTASDIIFCLHKCLNHAHAQTIKNRLHYDLTTQPIYFSDHLWFDLEGKGLVTQNVFSPKHSNPKLFYWFIAVKMTENLFKFGPLWPLCMYYWGHKHTVWHKTCFYRKSRTLDYILCSFISLKNIEINLSSWPFHLFVLCHFWCAPKDMRHLTQKVFSQTPTLHFILIYCCKNKQTLSSYMALWLFCIMQLVMCSWRHVAYDTEPLFTYTPQPLILCSVIALKC